MTVCSGDGLDKISASCGRRADARGSDDGCGEESEHAGEGPVEKALKEVRQAVAQRVVVDNARLACEQGLRVDGRSDRDEDGGLRRLHQLIRDALAKECGDPPSNRGCRELVESVEEAGGGERGEQRTNRASIRAEVESELVSQLARPVSGLHKTVWTDVESRNHDLKEQNDCSVRLDRMRLY